MKFRILTNGFEFTVEKRGLFRWIKLDSCKEFDTWYANCRGVYRFSTFDEACDFIKGISWHQVFYPAEIWRTPENFVQQPKTVRPKRTHAKRIRMNKL